MGDASLVWGSTPLLEANPKKAERDARAGLRPYALTALSPGSDGFGNAEAIITAVRSQLQDGSLATITSRDNREGKFRVKATAADHAGLDLAQRALTDEENVPGYSTLTYTPSVAFAYPTVYDVVYAQVKWEFDDFSETQCIRRFVIEFELLPFGRDMLPTVVQATTGVLPTVITQPVDDCSSTTGWTATNALVFGASGGALVASGAGIPTGATTSLRRDASFPSRVAGIQGSPNPAADRRYIYIDWRAPGRTNGLMPSFYSGGNGTWNPTERAAPFDYPAPQGFNRTWFDNRAGRVTGAATVEDWAVLTLTLNDIYPNNVIEIDGFGTVASDGTPDFQVDGVTTGWSVTNGSAPTSSGGVLSTTASGAYLPGPLTMTRALTIDITTTRYLRVDWVGGSNTPTPVMTARTSGGDFVCATVANQTLAGSAGVRTWYSVPNAAGNSLTGFIFGRGDAVVPRGGLYVLYDIQRTNVVPGSGTNMQQNRTLRIGGSARARASLVITAPAGQTLGDTTILYTRGATTGLQPQLRPRLVTAHTAIVSGSPAVSGAWTALDKPHVFLLPANRIREAAHLLMARLRTVSTGNGPQTYTLTWGATLVSSADVDIPESTQGISGTVTVALTPGGVPQVNEVGLLQLPTVPVAEDSTHAIRITLSGSSADLQLDEGWLCDLDNGALTVANTKGLTRFEVRTADLDHPERTVWGGYADGGAATGLVRADHRTVPVVTTNNTTAASLGDHQFEPGDIDLTTVTTSTEGSAASVRYHRSWPHTAGAPEPDAT